MITSAGLAPDLATIHLLEKGDLTDWEKGFLSSMKRCKTLSEKQQACFNKIRDKYLNKPATGQVGSGELPDDEMPF